MLLARLFQSNRFFDEVVGAGTAHLFDVPFFNREQAARVGPVFVDATTARSVGMLFQKRAFENQFATRSTAITLAASQGKRRYHILLTKADINEASQLAVSLTGAESRILDSAGAQPLFETLFQRSLAMINPAAGCVHWVCAGR